MKHTQTYTDTELEESIRRHNEQVSKQITEKVFREREKPYYGWPIEPSPVGVAQIRQRELIRQALEALHRGNLDDAKKILEMI